MPLQFTSAPPAASRYDGWRYEALKPGGSLIGAVAAPLLGCDTHWTGKTVPCLGAGCPHCADGKERRWTGYLALFCGPGDRRLVLLPASTARRSNELLVVGTYLRVEHGGPRQPPKLSLYSERKCPVTAIELEPILRFMWRRSLPADQQLTSASENRVYGMPSATRHLDTGDSNAADQPAARSPGRPDGVRGLGDDLLAHPLGGPVWG